MMGPEYFTVGAYINDGEILCPKCGDEAGLPASAQITEAELYSDFSEDGALYCDNCGEELIAPAESEESEEENGQDIEG